MLWGLEEMEHERGDREELPGGWWQRGREA